MQIYIYIYIVQTTASYYCNAQGLSWRFIQYSISMCRARVLSCVYVHTSTLGLAKFTEKCEGGRFRNWRSQFRIQFEKGGIRVTECLRQAMPSYTKICVSEFRCNLQLSMWCIGLNLKGTGQTLRDCQRELKHSKQVVWCFTPSQPLWLSQGILKHR